MYLLLNAVHMGLQTLKTEPVVEYNVKQVVMILYKTFATKKTVVM